MLNPRAPSTAAASLLCLIAMSCGDMQGWEPGQQALSITNGQPYSGHPSVGYLRVANSSLCTATLVGKQTVLTAAHCLHPGASHVFYAGGKAYNASAVVRHHGWSMSTLSNDIGLVRLQTAPPITPSIASDQAPYQGLKLTLIGYGKTSSYKSDAGTKRIAVNSVKQVDQTRFTFAGSGGSIGNTCKGDSGGPAFATLGGKEVQVGVTSAGQTPCGTLGVDTRVDAYYSWLKNQSGNDLYTGAVQDKTAPKVAITTPADGAKVPTDVKVEITASDNVGVVEVDLLLDSVSQSPLYSPPWTYHLILSAGTHLLKAVAKDKAGNRAEHQISVTMQPGTTPPPKGGYGTSCTRGDECKSGMCARDAATGKMFCTILCHPSKNTCPSGAECLGAGDKLWVCGPPLSTQALDDYLLTGGCALGGGPDPAPPWFILMAIAGLLARARRRGP